jgi:hypothetical protein
LNDHTTTQQQQDNTDTNITTMNGVMVKKSMINIVKPNISPVPQLQQTVAEQYSLRHLPQQQQRSNTMSWFYGSGTVQDTKWLFANNDPPYEPLNAQQSKLSMWAPHLKWEADRLGNNKYT